MRVRCLGDGRHGIVEKAYGVDDKEVGIMLESRIVRRMAVRVEVRG